MDLSSHDSENRQAAVDLVLFEVAGRSYGADALDVGRIDHLSADLPIASQLGESKSARALVVRSSGGEVQIPIDRFVGIQAAPVRALRTLPAVARGLVEPALVGFFLREQEIILLIDLQALVNQRNPGEDAGGREAAIR